MSKRKFPRRLTVSGGPLGWLGACAIVGSLWAASLAEAQVAPPNAQPVSRSRVAQKAPQAPLAWQVLETANFRVLSYGQQAVDARFGAACEKLRDDLCAKWHSPAADGETWSPKCDVVLHPNDASYLREVGAGALSTVASSLVDYNKGSISLRRVDVRNQQSSWLTAALPHELTHVILADCFGGRAVPRWIDEGVALLADPAEKRQRHKVEMDQAVASRLSFRVVELMTLEDYPASNRWGAFYGQSLSLVEYMTQQRSPDDFIRFVQVSMDKGYDASLREVYGLAGVADLERRWQTKADLPQAVASARPRSSGMTLAEASTAPASSN